MKINSKWGLGSKEEEEKLRKSNSAREDPLGGVGAPECRLSSKLDLKGANCSKRRNKKQIKENKRK